MISIVELQADIDSARGRVAALAAERDKLECAPLDAASLEKRIDAAIASAARDAEYTLAHLDARRSAFSPFEFNRYAKDNLFGALAVLMPADLKKWLTAKGAPEGLTPAEHQLRSAETNAALRAALIDEELSLRRFEAQVGRHELRRPDADPAILLAPTHELEAAASQKPAARSSLRRAG